jgi:Glycosyl hydrolase family 26
MTARRFLGIAVAVVLPLIVAGGSLVLLSPAGHRWVPAGTNQASPSPAAHAHISIRKPLIGGRFAGAPRSFQGARSFQAATGIRPRLAPYYSSWWEPFRRKFAETAYASGTIPVVQITPTNVAMTSIIAGKQDWYLVRYAGAVRSFGHPVVISFAPEPNGWWYRWGWTNAPASHFAPAWRHIVTVFRSHGARNVTWMWTVNRDKPGTGPVADYWPGAHYVDWVGIDGYFYRPTQKFSNVFDAVIRDVRTFTGKPILLAETAVGPEAGQVAGIHELFAGVRKHHLIGLIWFDICQHGAIYHQCWKLEGHPRVIAAFRAAARSLVRAGRA